MAYNVFRDGGFLNAVTQIFEKLKGLLDSKYVKPSGGIPASDLAPGVIPSASTAAPLADGTASAGSSADYARGDHRHPHDPSKQGTLVSGTNIKTINGQSVLGAGDLEIESDIPLSVVDGKICITYEKEIE